MKKLFLFALVATMFAACATDETRDVVTTTTPETLTVSFEDADSRIQLQDGKTVWTQGDLVSVFYRSDANQKWQFQGATGDRTGTLKRIATMEATHELSNVVVVYPYNENYYINPKSCNIEASLPAEQTYLADSYGVGNNIMVSYGEYNQVVLKSVCGWLKVQLTGNGETVKNIKLKGNNGEQVAGQLYINSADATAVLASEMGKVEDDGSAGANLSFEDTVLTEVTLNCGEGVTLSAEPTAFYIALPPQTFEKGLTVDVTTTDGVTMTQTTEKSVVISRNSIQPMSAFKYEGVPNDEIWYTAIEKVEPNRSDVFGANIVSNVWDSTTGKGVITFNGNVTMIGSSAFYECRNLTSIAIPDSAMSIKDRAFADCSNLATIAIPDNVTNIGKSAFDGCCSLTSVTIPKNVTSIKERVFYACSNLTSIKIPNSITTIYNDAFYNCISLASVIIPDSVTSIGNSAFAGCIGLTSVTIGNSITIIGGSAFSGCNSLTTVTIGYSVTRIENHAFSGCSSLTNVIIPNRVTFIGDYTFSGCSNLTSIIIPDSVTSIGHTAFAGCIGLTSITIGNSITSIKEDTFKGCTGLTSITIPKNITSISREAFYECSNLKDVYCKATIPPTGGVYMFSHYNNGYYPLECKIYVPRESVEMYKAAEYWSDYANYIVGYDF